MIKNLVILVMVVAVWGVGLGLMLIGQTQFTPEVEDNNYVHASRYVEYHFPAEEVYISLNEAEQLINIMGTSFKLYLPYFDYGFGSYQQATVTGEEVVPFYPLSGRLAGAQVELEWSSAIDKKIPNIGCNTVNIIMDYNPQISALPTNAIRGLYCE